MHAGTEILRFISNLVHSDTRQKLKILLTFSQKKNKTNHKYTIFFLTNIIN